MDLVLEVSGRRPVVGGSGDANSRGISRLVVVDDDRVFEAAKVTERLHDGLLEQGNVVFFQPFIEELAGHLNGEDMLVELDWSDRLKPGFEALRSNLIPDQL